MLAILASIVAAEPGYTFSESKGVVHVSRLTLFDDKRNFLNLSIDDFELSSEYVFHANNRLRQLVVELTNRPVHKEEAGCAGSSVIAAGDRVASFSFQNVPVREILDKFFTSSGFSIWLVTFPEIPSLTTNGFFTSTSVFSPKLPESALPGYDPVRKQTGIGWKQSPWTSRDEATTPGAHLSRDKPK